MGRPGLAALFLLTTIATPTLAQDASDPFANCRKTSQTVAFNGKAHQRLSFRYLDCGGAGADMPALSFEAGNILRTVSARAEDANGPTARFWPLGAKAPAQRIAEIAEPLTALEEKGRCEVALDAGSAAFHYTPKSDYLGELEANGLWGACGPYGEGSDTVQYWRVIDGALIVHVSLLQDTPLFDPSSFSYVNTEIPGVAE
jgi:hypothetical protein